MKTMASLSVRVAWLAVLLPTAFLGLSACGSKDKPAHGKGAQEQAHKQFAPVDAAVLNKLAKTDIPGMKRDEGRPPSGDALEVTYHSLDSAAPLTVRVRVRGCDSDVCAPPKLDVWKAKEKNLPHYVMNMTPAFKEDPKKTMEASLLDVDGHKAVAFHWFGFSKRSVKGVSMTSATNHLFAYYNAGDKALVMVDVWPGPTKGAGPANLQEFKKSTPPKKALEDAAIKAIQAFAKGI